jgi:hypothetical protein
MRAGRHHGCRVSRAIDASDRDDAELLGHPIRRLAPDTSPFPRHDRVRIPPQAAASRSGLLLPLP